MLCNNSSRSKESNDSMIKVRRNAEKKVQLKEDSSLQMVMSLQWNDAKRMRFLLHCIKFIENKGQEIWSMQT